MTLVTAPVEPDRPPCRQLTGHNLNVGDAIVLLGLYLTEISHGLLIVWGDAPPSDGQITLTLDDTTHVHLCVSLIEQNGIWFGLRVKDPDSVQAYLRRTPEAWRVDFEKKLCTQPTKQSPTRSNDDAHNGEIAPADSMLAIELTPQPSGPPPLRAGIIHFSSTEMLKETMETELKMGAYSPNPKRFLSNLSTP